MSISIKKDSWHVKDGNGQYRGTAIFSSTLPSEAQQIVAESIAEINAVKATIPADYTELSNKVDGLDDDLTDLSADVSDLSNAIDELTDGGIKPLMTSFVDGWNLLDTAKYTEKSMIGTDGVITSSPVWYLATVPVTANTTYYCYAENNTNKEIRRVVLFDASMDYVTYADWATTITPANNGYAVCMIRYSDDVSERPYAYFTNVVADDRNLKIPDLVVDQGQIVGIEQIKQQKRICAINFQFDDCDAKDADIVDIFDAQNERCGFAFIASAANRNTKAATYLGYQSKGYEILSHSTDGAAMNAVTEDMTVQYAMIRIRDSYYHLKKLGFNVRGWVTPNSELAPEFLPLLTPYYDYATTVYYYYGSTASDGSTTPYVTNDYSTLKLHRMSLESHTLAECKAAVDAAIEASGLLTFYGHPVNLDVNSNFTTANLNELIDYIQDKASNYRCYLLRPSDAIDCYFHTRHSDWLEQKNAIGEKITSPSSPTTGAFLVWNGTAWVAQTLATWQGGNY